MGNFNEGKQFQMQLLLQSRRQYLPPPHNSTGCHKSMGIRIGDEAHAKSKSNSQSQVGWLLTQPPKHLTFKNSIVNYVMHQPGCHKVILIISCCLPNLNGNAITFILLCLFLIYDLAGWHLSKLCHVVVHQLHGPHGGARAGVSLPWVW